MRKFSVLLVLLFAFIPFLAIADDEAPPLPDENNSSASTSSSGDSDYIQAGTVEQKQTGDMLDSGAVEAKATKTPVPVAAPTRAPEPTAVPTPRPRPAPVIKKAAPRPTRVPTPAPTRAAAAFPDLAISKANIEEIKQKGTVNNFYGLLSTDRKFTLTLSLENRGTSTALYTTVELKSGHVSILTNEPEKNLGSILPGSKLDLVYPVMVLASYDGELKLPLSLKVTANGLVKEYPIDVYIDEAVPYLMYIGGGLLILLIILILILVLRGGKKGNVSKGKDYDFKL
jgi:hypothetical protein